MFKKIKLNIIQTCSNYPKAIIAITLLFSLLIISGIPKIVQDDDMVRLLPEELPSIKVFSEITDEFGNYEFMYVAVGNKDRDVFESKFLKIAWDISKEFEELKECEEVISISTLSKMDTTSDTMIVVDDLVPKASLNTNEIKAIKEYLNKNIDIKSRIISKNSDYLNIIIRPKDNHDYAFLAKEIHNITEKYKYNNNEEELEFHFGGQAYITGAVPDIVAQEVKVLAAYGLILMTLILLINLRNLQSVLLILNIILLSLLSMLGFMGWVYHFTESDSFYFTLNNTSMPIILLTIANSDGVHIISRFFKELRISRNKSKAIIDTMNNLFKPISLTSLTTMCAFLTLIFSPLEGMNAYGITLAFGIGWAWILSLTMMPALISILKWNPDSKAITKPSFMESMMNKFGEISTKNPKKILLIGLMGVLISIIGLFNLNVEVNMSKMFSKGSIIRDSANFLDENMTGNLNVLVKASSIQGSGGMKEPENLKDVEKLQNYLNKMPAVTSTISIVDVIKQLHRVIEFDNPKYETIPETRGKINTLFTLYQMNEDSDVSSLINDDDEAIVLTALMKTFSTSDMAIFKQDIENFIKKEISSDIIYLKDSTAIYGHINEETDSTISITNLDGDVLNLSYNNILSVSKGNDDLKLEISGVMAFLADFIWLVIKTSAISIICSILIICFIASLFYKSLRFGILSIIPLLAAIIINFGLMGLFGIDITHMTAILSSIIIGVGVDFSIHYTSEYKNLIEEKKSNKTIKTINNVGHPILLDALSNMGFASLMLSTIIPMTQIGGLMVVAMGACSIGTLTLLASSIEILKHKLS